MTVLLEHRAKELLRRYGIPATEARLARTADEAAALARAAGGSVAMKIAAPGIVHKAAAGGVRLNVEAVDAEAAFGEIVDAAGAEDVEGVVVEPMAAPGHEAVVGAVRDPVFGPVVMCGVGGTGVEEAANVAFRLAPLGAADLRYLAQAAAYPDGADALTAILSAVGGPEGLLFKENIAELDINPVILSGCAAVVVDAHIVLSEDEPAEPSAFGCLDPAARKTLQKDIHESLRPIFHPAGIVVVGASAQPGKLGFRIVQNLVDFGYAGTLYPVHPKAESIYGCKAFPSVGDLPETVDRAIVAIGARGVPEALRQCAAKGVRVAQILTAGFAEWDDEGAKLENAIGDVAEATGMRIVGPNTIGAYCGAAKITMSTPRHAPESAGGITFISQSGTYAWDMIHRAKVLGLPLGKSLSCGNCADVTPTDYLLYAAEDPDTDILAMYLETDRDAGRFFRLAREIEKPLVLFKGGRSAAGMRAATSHTGALAADGNLWLAAARQAGAVVVDSMDELLDVLLAHAAFGRADGRRLALFGSGGGVSVVSADVAEANGMTFADFGGETRRRLAKFGVPGTSVDNPIDIPVWGLKRDGTFIFHEIVELLAADAGVDSIIAYVEMNSIFEFSDNVASGQAEMEAIVRSLLRADTAGIALSAVLRTAGDKAQDDILRVARPRLLENGIAVYPTTARAIRAHARMAPSQVHP
ncbi:MAG: acetate--CoA ligase family protein [Rhodospirillaceae bacterium]|nr:acetate--CoA ligase family protein [Rhodospirillaceae bacterium]